MRRSEFHSAGHPLPRTISYKSLAEGLGKAPKKFMSFCFAQVPYVLPDFPVPNHMLKAA